MDIAGPIQVVEVKEDVVVLDFNHPLAGKDLSFEITIVEIDNDEPSEPAN